MKRYSLFHDNQDGIAELQDDVDGEWIRYADHVEAMKRIAGYSAQQAEPDEGDEESEGAVMPVHWDLFPGWLIDQHEGDTITEELLQSALADMLKVHPVSPAPSASPAAPIDMVLHCPRCGMQHIDAPERFETDENRPYRIPGLWDNPPHRSHLCHGCGHVWRPADVPTNGVAAVKTQGKADSPIGASPAALMDSDALRQWTDDISKAGLSRPSASERAAFRDGFVRALRASKEGA